MAHADKCPAIEGMVKRGWESGRSECGGSEDRRMG